MFLLRYTDAPVANLPASTDVESVPGREAPSERAAASRNATYRQYIFRRHTTYGKQAG